MLPVCNHFFVPRCVLGVLWWHSVEWTLAGGERERASEGKFQRLWWWLYSTRVMAQQGLLLPATMSQARSCGRHGAGMTAVKTDGQAAAAENPTGGLMAKQNKWICSRLQGGTPRCEYMTHNDESAVWWEDFLGFVDTVNHLSHTQKKHPSTQTYLQQLCCMIL